ncbi:hypothetical protein XbrCFBP1976_15945 [Xanthomonas bromi]|uniref:Secreted protein n=1 Tax=Xanthomonas bromi TaxID=56449 RepID=A0ABX5BQ28_9XANT|nr:hypothetical protein XbrCFBP1976_15945 [Xanthomonas bromi]
MIKRSNKNLSSAGSLVATCLPHASSPTDGDVRTGNDIARTKEADQTALLSASRIACTARHHAPTISTRPCPPTVAAWTPHKSLHGRTCSVSCDGGQARKP